MARINIEECWWSDPRRAKLVKLFLGDSQAANGLAVEAWRLAQEFWKHGRKMIPAEHFDGLDNGSKLIEAGLGVLRDGSVYLRGSSTYLEWVNDKREAGKIGGQKSAESRRKNTGSAQPKPKKTRSSAEAAPKHAEPSVSGSFSDSLSDSDSGSEKVSSDKKLNAEIWDAYQEEYKARYQETPTRNAMVNGQIGQLGKRLGRDAIEVVRFYLRHNKAYYVQAQHTVGPMLKDAEALHTQWKRGEAVLPSQAREVERTQHNFDSFEQAAKILDRQGGSRGD